jgi:hypothetical protein
MHAFVLNDPSTPIPVSVVSGGGGGSSNVSGNHVGLPNGSDTNLIVAAQPQQLWRTTFAKTLNGAVDSTFFTQVGTLGAGITYGQSSGNLVINSGTAANSELILRSTRAFSDMLELRWQTILSQRIAGNSFSVELVDVIGDGLVLTVNSATSVTVTLATNPFDSQNIGQFVNIGAVSGVAGAIPGRYAISAVAGNTVTFTVAGWPASGSGTCSLFGWNFHRVEYSGVTATAANYDTGRRGWASGNTVATVNNTAAPGHLGVITSEDGMGAFLDQLVASSAGLQTAMRASRVANIPDETANLFLQIRVQNGSTAPASTTAWTIGLVSVSNYAAQNVSINSIRPQTFNAALPVSVLNVPSVGLAGNNTLTTVTTLTSMTSGNLGIPGAVADVTSAALTATATVAAITPSFGTSYEVNVPVTAVTGTTPTLDFSIEESDDGGTNWFKVYDFPRITAVGMYRSPKLPLTGNRVRYVQSVSGTTPSFTRAVNRLQGSEHPTPLRQVIDRSIVLTTANSTTSTLNVQNCRNFQLAINIGAATTAPALQLEGSDDNGATWYAIGAPLTAVASSTVSLTVNNVQAQLVRARVSTVGAAVTAGYVLVKGF